MGRAASLALVAVACSSQPPPPATAVFTIDTLAALHDRSVTPPGAPLPFMGGDYPSFGTGVQSAASAGLSVFPAFAEGQPAAYLQTEMWEDFERVWMQPMYVAVVPEGAPEPLPVFGVSAGSAFYAPYWQVFNYTPIAGIQFKSSRDVIDSGVKLTAGVGKFCSLTGDGNLGTAVQQGAAVPVRPLNGAVVGQARATDGYVDGRLTHCIDLGNDQRFTWNYENLVVDETPMYAFAREGTNQAPIPVDLPRIAGTGPLHAPRCDGRGNCAGVSNGVPTFGGLWRLSTVLLPPSADVYVRPLASAAKLRGLVEDMGFPAAVPDQDLGDDFSLRVASNGSDCLGQGKRVAACKWLDSQNAIEAQLPDFRVTETGTRLSCPLILFAAKPLPAP
jgi:hypothetical protein